MGKKKKREPKQSTGAGESLAPEVPAVSSTVPGPDALEGGGPTLDADEQHHLLYKGAGGQMAVMSEFLYRQINVAVPEVDVGDDIFVVRDKDEAVIRAQAKYSKADEQQNGSYVTQFMLPWAQFDLPEDIPALVYVLAVRYKDHWTDFIVIRRSVLRRLHARHDVGTVVKNDAGDPIALKLRLVFTVADVTAKGGFSLKKYRDAFKPWPPPQLANREDGQPGRE